ncbi:hypothetical protein GGX14DRAFT_394100 [Mycena pura]|uniref:Uncharacterized protein n=1 Tax=Mycena pura TaxID=153505 RepID=A0AAD6YFT6_9AGAR|nr:hypothetical protein GGX14DRAFT_394100 [Mycena pura]
MYHADELPPYTPASEKEDTRGQVAWRSLSQLASSRLLSLVAGGGRGSKKGIPKQLLLSALTSAQSEFFSIWAMGRSYIYAPTNSSVSPDILLVNPNSQMESWANMNCQWITSALKVNAPTPQRSTAAAQARESRSRTPFAMMTSAGAALDNPDGSRDSVATTRDSLNLQRHQSGTLIRGRTASRLSPWQCACSAVTRVLK